MTTMYSLPERVVSALTEFASMVPAEVEELNDFIGKNLESLISRESTYERSTKADFKKTGSEKAFRMLDAFVPLIFNTVSSAKDAKESVDDVVLAYGTALSKSQKPEEIRGLKKSLRKNIAALFENPRIRIKAKSVRLLTTHDRNFTGCEIISDVRPIFSTDGKIKIDAAVFFHTLHVEFAHREGSVYVAMDSNDLRQLQGAVNRAVEKEALLSDFVERAGVEHVKVS